MCESRKCRRTTLTCTGLQPRSARSPLGQEPILHGDAPAHRRTWRPGCRKRRDRRRIRSGIYGVFPSLPHVWRCTPAATTFMRSMGRSECCNVHSPEERGQGPCRIRSWYPQAERPVYLDLSLECCDEILRRSKRRRQCCERQGNVGAAIGGGPMSSELSVCCIILDVNVAVSELEAGRESRESLPGIESP